MRYAWTLPVALVLLLNNNGPRLTAQTAEENVLHASRQIGIQDLFTITQSNPEDVRAFPLIENGEDMLATTLSRDHEHWTKAAPWAHHGATRSWRSKTTKPFIHIVQYPPQGAGASSYEAHFDWHRPSPRNPIATIRHLGELVSEKIFHKMQSQYKIALALDRADRRRDLEPRQRYTGQ